MAAWLLQVLFVGIGTLIGATAGWWIRSVDFGEAAPPADEPQPRQDPIAPAAEQRPDFDAVERMIAKMQQLTASVAADVGEHNCRVQEINDELTTIDKDEADVLFVVEKLVKVNEVMQAQLDQAEQRLQDQAKEIESHVKDARTDALTKVWNRRHFDDELQKCERALRDSNRPSVVMMLDVDHFKQFNDTYGHQAGDEVLKGVARTFSEIVASSGIVCRYGGEEFSILFPGFESKAAMPVAERTRAAIAEIVFEFEGLDLNVTASAGLAELQDGENSADVLKRADDALYASKEAGRNCGHWHDGKVSHLMRPQPADADSANEPRSQEASPASDRAADREHFAADVDRRIAEWKRGGSPLSVLLVQIDRIEEIAEAHGEEGAKVVLRAAEQFLKAAMREMDHIVAYRDSIFALLLPGAEMMETCSVAERLRASIARCDLPVDGEKLSFTVSLGTAQVADEDDSEKLMLRAENSLNAANEAGGNCSFSATADGDVRSMELSS